MQQRSVASWFHAISVATEKWTAQHCAFVVEGYFKMAVQPLQHDDYFADTLTFLVMAMLPVVTP